MPTSDGQSREPVEKSIASTVVKPWRANPAPISIAAAVRGMSFARSQRAPASSSTIAAARLPSARRRAFMCSLARTSTPAAAESAPRTVNARTSETTFHVPVG